MKAILVIDMPKECCDGCPCYYEEAYRCQVHMEIDEDLYNGKPSWCPLRPLPQKKGKYGEPHEYDTDIHYEIGWNDCLREIENG